jgi:hypothetical protein
VTSTSTARRYFIKGVLYRSSWHSSIPSFWKWTKKPDDSRYKYGFFYPPSTADFYQQNPTFARPVHLGLEGSFHLNLCLLTFFKFMPCKAKLCLSRHNPLEPDEIRWLLFLGQVAGLRTILASYCPHQVPEEFDNKTLGRTLLGIFPSQTTPCYDLETRLGGPRALPQPLRTQPDNLTDAEWDHAAWLYAEWVRRYGGDDSRVYTADDWALFIEDEE